MTFRNKYVLVWKEKVFYWLVEFSWLWKELRILIKPFEILNSVGGIFGRVDRNR
jgi:hypothetical protein